MAASTTRTSAGLDAHRVSRSMWNAAQFEWLRQFSVDDSQLKTGLVYFIQGGPAIKIGYTGKDTVAARVAAIQTGNPYPLRVRASIAGNPWLEQRLHHLYGAWRMEGEWFRASSPGLLCLIAYVNERLFV